MGNKNHIVLVFLAFLTGCSASASDPASNTGWVALHAQTVSGPHDGPYELIVRNELAHIWAMTEIRALNDTGAAIDLGVTSSFYDDPGNGGLKRNVGFIVTESTLDGMQIKSNNGPIEFTTWPDLSIRLERGRVELPVSAHCPAPAASGMALCVGNDGVLYATGRNGTVTALAGP